MKIERMLTIIVMLLNRNRVTANELAEKFEVSVRTIYRDIETINLAKSATALGEPVMNDSDLSVYISGFEKNGFTPSINWYRNLNRNWDLLGEVSPIVHQKTLMVYGEKDVIPPLPNIQEFVPNIDVKSLDTGHWIQEEKPEELNQMILQWLKNE